MSKYTREDLVSMDDDELTYAYEAVFEGMKSMPSTKKRPQIIKEILDAQEEQSEEETPSEKKQRTAPVAQVRSTLLKTKSPPKSALVPKKQAKKKSQEVSYTVEPQTVSQILVEEDIMSEEQPEGSERSERSEGSEGVSKSRRGRPPKQVARVSLSSSSEEAIQKYEPPAPRKTATVKEGGSEKVDSILERIKKTAKVNLLNPKASFQKGDVVREQEPESITPVVVSEANLVSVQLPVYEQAKKSITDFLHDVGFTETLEKAPSPKKTKSPKKKPAVTVDEELEKMAKKSKTKKTLVEKLEEVGEGEGEAEGEAEGEFFGFGEPERVSVIESVEPVEQATSVKPGKQEVGIRKSIRDILEEEKTKTLEEDLRYAKEKELEREKELELEKRSQAEQTIMKKITRRPIVVRSVTEEGEEGEEGGEEPVVPRKAPNKAPNKAPSPTKSVEEREEEFKQKMLIDPEKWKGVPLEDIPFKEFKRSKAAPVAKPVAKPVAAPAATSVAEIVSQASQQEKPPSKRPSKKKEKVEEILTEIEEPEPMVVKKTIKKSVVKDSETGPKEVVQSEKEIEEEVLPKSRPSTKPSKPSSQKSQTAAVDVVAILQEVDQSRLKPGRGANVYKTDEVRDILRKLPGVKTTGKNKEELVERLQAEMKKYGL
jgi:hypothetical protein